MVLKIAIMGLDKVLYKNHHRNFLQDSNPDQMYGNLQILDYNKIELIIPVICV
jgi:hypothetical protein